MGFVKVEQQGHVGILTIDRQEALNALNSQVLNDLDAAIDEVAANDDVYVVVLTGAGRSFVAGADIGEMKGFSSADGKKFGVHGGGVFLKLENMAKPVIAAINGFALGGGCELSMSCDIRIASEKAVFGQPEVNLGLIPCFGGTQRLSRLVGTGLAKELIFTARNVKPEEAKAIGLVNKVVPAEDLMYEAKAMLTTIIGKAPIAVRYAKVAITRGVNLDLMNALELENDLSALAFASDDAKEGTTAFLEKRPANFQNR